MTELLDTSFDYPPFQKALPYFPDYGYQVTVVFLQDNFELNRKTQETIKTIITELKCKLIAIGLRTLWEHYMLILILVKCASIDGRYSNTDHSKKEPHSGFNVGFELNIWKQWCELLNRKPSSPVMEAADMMNSKEKNFMIKHSKLKYTKGQVWFCLKGETEEDTDALLKVIIIYSKSANY